MSDRGMKKWNAYKSLPEHQPVIDQIIEGQYKVSKPVISSDEAELINDALVNYHGELIKIGFYRNGTINYITTTIKKIDVDFKQLILTNKEKILFKELISLSHKL